jgi:hypothetical protein
MKRFFDYEEISYENKEVEKFILENEQYERFIVSGNRDDTFFSGLADLVGRHNKTLVILIACMKEYPKDIHEASLKSNVLLYEIGKMGMKSVLESRVRLYEKTVKNSIAIPKEFL